MPTYTHDELEAAFHHYEATARRATETGDWGIFADQFTPDATYWEHLYGHMRGRDEIRSWIVRTMAAYPGRVMPHFPSDWHVVDAANGRVVVYIQNRMKDPGDGSIHQAPNVTILQYAGDNQWSYQEDVYNVTDFVTMLGSWEARVRELGGDPHSFADATT